MDSNNAAHCVIQLTLRVDACRAFLLRMMTIKKLHLTTKLHQKAMHPLVITMQGLSSISVHPVSRTFLANYQQWQEKCVPIERPTLNLCAAPGPVDTNPAVPANDSLSIGKIFLVTPFLSWPCPLVELWLIEYRVIEEEERNYGKLKMGIVNFRIRNLRKLRQSFLRRFSPADLLESKWILVK